MAEPIRCNYCRQRHMPRFLCDPAKAYLDAVHARAGSFDMPTIELPDVVPPVPGLGEPGDTLIAQLVVQGAAVELENGVTHPAVVFTGRDPAGPLPRWLYVGTDDELRGAAELVREMTELAIRRADAANGGGHG